MSIFSGERTVRFGAVKFDIFTLFDYLKYTTRARYRQCDRLHNENCKNPKFESFIFFIQTVLSGSSFPGFSLGRIGTPPIVQINAVPRSAARARYATRNIGVRTCCLLRETCAKRAAARHSIIAAFNFHVSNDIIKIRNGINPRPTDNTNFNYMKIVD
ncbi:hypothetical protein [Burkholderia sp. MSMB1459WGS]|uniref:hypothetical protein n=1 Tax=Burkholderia sp. MSMB1459WGS TaxID=1637970 RepID=UPI00211D4FF1|nr:hypothetical protein [Burkholderia sp. MSMB1459WGS]